MFSAIFLAVIAIVLAIITLSLVVTNRNKRNEIKHLKHLNRNLIWYSATCLWICGGTTLVAGADFYDLFSPNGGRDWYALGENREIIGTAEEIYPGLLAHLAGFEALEKYAKEHGSIGRNGIITPEDIRILKAAGFKVQPATP